MLGYGFVEFTSPQSAELAVQELTKSGIQAQMARLTPLYSSHHSHHNHHHNHHNHNNGNNNNNNNSQQHNQNSSDNVSLINNSILLDWILQYHVLALDKYVHRYGGSFLNWSTSTLSFQIAF